MLTAAAAFFLLSLSLFSVSQCDTITLEELELLSQVPNYVPVCAGKECTYRCMLVRDRARKSLWLATQCSPPPLCFVRRSSLSFF